MKISFFIKQLESYNTISAKGLLDIANILEMSSELHDYFYNFSEHSTFPILDTYFSEIYTNSSICDKIKKAILDENTISDTASQNLANIRRKKRHLEQDIKNRLNTILHSSTYSKYIQENVVMIRNDRYVIPVKEEYRSQIKGFIHDMSASGSTVFIEPISVFEANNEINNLKIEEKSEIDRILQSLSQTLYPFTNQYKNR